MAVRIRFKRLGRKKQPIYRVVVAEQSAARDGKVVEELGIHNPRKESGELQVDQERLKHWLAVGAQPSEPVRRLLGKVGILEKVVKVPAHPGVSKKDKKGKE